MNGFPHPAARICALLLLTAFLAAPAENSPSTPDLLYSLQAATLTAFNAYVARTEVQNAATLTNGPFLWIDGLPDDQRGQAISKLRAGDVQLRRLSIGKGDNNPNIPGGMIHDWQGIIFIPGARLEDVLQILQDYDHQSAYYAPDVSQSRIESHGQSHPRSQVTVSPWDYEMRLTTFRLCNKLCNRLANH